MKKAALEALKKDTVTALRIINQQGLSDAFAHLSARLDDSQKMLFMPRKSPALVKPKDLFVVDFDKEVPQSSVLQAICKTRGEVRAVMRRKGSPTGPLSPHRHKGLGNISRQESKFEQWVFLRPY